MIFIYFLMRFQNAMSSSKKESKKSNLTILVIVMILAAVAIMLGIWYFSYKAISSPGVQEIAKTALPLMLAA